MSRRQVGSLEMEESFALESLQYNVEQPKDHKDITPDAPEFPKISDCRFKCVTAPISTNGENCVLENHNSNDNEKSPTPCENLIEGEDYELCEKNHVIESRFSDVNVQDIVQEIMTLEDRIDSLEKILKDSQYVSSHPQVEEEQREKIKGFKIAIRQTAEENAKLRRKNKFLEQIWLQMRETLFC